MRVGRLLVAVGVAAVGLLGCSSAAAVADWSPRAGMPFAEPRQVHPVRGVTEVRLTAHAGRITVSGSPVLAQPFNNSLVGPTLHVRPGGTLRATVRNLTSRPTNIHWHGLHVSPAGISDNVFRVFAPGSRNESVVRIPRDHPPGTFWYHVHLHGLTEDQVMGGLSGLLIVEGGERLLPKPLRKAERRQIALRDLQTRGDEAIVSAIRPNAPTTRLVNGLLRPRMRLRSGETQLWRIANVGADVYHRITLEGHPLHVVAEDGSPAWRVRRARTLLLPPGKRFDVLVTGGKPGTYKLKTVPYDQGSLRVPRSELARVTVTGPARRATAPVPRRLRTPHSPIDRRPVARKRSFRFSFGTGPEFTALINGKRFDPDRTDVAPVLGTVEEWTLINETEEDHPFHIHVNDFQVMSVNGKPYRAAGLQDVVNVPKNGGRVVIRIPFDDFTGHFVFHCHILVHEDAGMMRTVEVVRRGERPTPPPGGHAHLGAVAAAAPWASRGTPGPFAGSAASGAPGEPRRICLLLARRRL